MSEKIRRTDPNLVLNSSEQMLSDDEISNFWNHETTQLVGGVYTALGERFSHLYGICPINVFDPENFLLFREVTQSRFSRGGFCCGNTIGLNLTYINNNRKLLEVVAHEVGEMAANRFSNKFPEMAFIDEAIIETVSQENLYWLAPTIKDDVLPVAYERARVAVDTMAKNMFHKQPNQFSYPHEVSELMKKSVFTGRHDEFIQSYLDVYGGERAISMLKVLTNFGPSGFEKSTMKSGALSEQRYKLLLRFLGGEEIDVEGRLEDIESEDVRLGKMVYEINANKVTVDYSLIQADIPLYELVPHKYQPMLIRSGLRQHVEKFIEFFQQQSGGHNNRKTPVLIVPRVVKSEQSLEDRTALETWRLLSDSFGLSSAPSGVVEESGSQERREYYRLDSIGVNIHGRKAYLLVSSRSKKRARAYNPGGGGNEFRVLARIFSDEEFNFVLDRKRGWW